jgi:dTDP-4-dehydrorhamnose reductase
VLSNALNLSALFARHGGVVNLACAGETSWHGFATAIVGGLKSRGVRFVVETITPIATADFPTKAKRPGNSRLDLSQLRDRFGLTPPTWQEALSTELDSLVTRQGEQAVLAMRA